MRPSVEISVLNRGNNLQTPWLRGSVVLSYALLLGGLLTVFAATYMVVVSYSNLPASDGWEQIDVVLRGVSPLSPAWLWSQHNEHRLVIPKLFLAADLLWFRGNQKLLLGSILAAQFLLLMLLAWTMRALGGWDGTAWRSGVGIAAFCLFWPTQWENFIIGFQICFVLPGLLATLSFVELMLYWKRSGRPHSELYLLLSIMTALAATYSLANGNLLWPILVAAALLLRLPRSAVLGYIVTGAVSTALYFYHYSRPPQHASPVASIHTPLRILEYIAAYFGTPFIRHDLRLAMLTGAIGLAGAVYVFFRGRFYLHDGEPFPILLVLILIFCLGTAFITSLGRLNFGIVQAFASRYHTIALLFWCCLGLLWLMAESQYAYKRSRFLIAQICMLAVIAWSSHLTRTEIRGARLRAFNFHVAAIALFTGAYDEVQFEKAAITNPRAIPDESRFMQKNSLSAYSDDAYKQLGKPLDAMYHIAAADECAGALESTVSVRSFGTPPVFRIRGWAWDRKHHRPPNAVVATTDGIITGLGAVGEWRPTAREAEPRVSNNYVGYAGYVRRLQPGAAVKLYAILRGQPQMACYFASAELAQ